MSVATVTPSTTTSTTRTATPQPFEGRMPRPVRADGWVTALRRAIQRRRSVATGTAHPDQSLTDAYLDRHGSAQLDPRSMAAFLQR